MNLVRTLLVTLGLLLVSLAIQLLVYSTTFTYESASNSLFVVGVLLFLPSLVVVTGAYEVFYGFRYSMSVLFRKDFRSHYPRFIEYKNEKFKRYKTTIFIELMVVSTILVIVALIFARMVK